MRRLALPLLCLLTALGARPGSAPRSGDAVAHHLRHELAVAAGRRLAAADIRAGTSQEAPAPEPVLMAPAPALVAPIVRVLPPHAVRRHSAAPASLTLGAHRLSALRGQPDAPAHAALPLLRRGYRATAPPPRADIPPLTNSLARPA